MSEEVRGRDVTIRFDGKKCIHSRNCVLGRPDVFVPNAKGAWIHPDRATLCRCGASANKPFCDGSHVRAGFGATGEPASKESEALPARNGSLAVTPAPNGPLRVQGPHEIVTGTGRTILRTNESYLCRCGASANKPYCDGSHKRIGFTA